MYEKIYILNFNRLAFQKFIDNYRLFVDRDFLIN